MLDLIFSIAGGASLLGAVALAVRVDLHEARTAPQVLPWTPRRPPEPRRLGHGLRLIRPDR